MAPRNVLCFLIENFRFEKGKYNQYIIGITTAGMSDENGSEIEPEEEIEDETEEEEEEIKNQEDLLNKNTKSFRCLAQVKISRSSLLLDPFYWFPEVEDPHLDEALWYDAAPPVYDAIGREKYIDICKSEKVRPFRRVLNSLDSNCLDLRVSNFDSLYLPSGIPQK